MPTQQVESIKQFTPKLVSKSHFLSKATTKAASSFKLGGSTLDIKLELDRTTQVATVKEFKLNPVAASKLSRKSNIVETISSAILPDADSVKIMKDYMKKVKIEKEVIDNGKFYFVTARRRKQEDMASNGLLRLTREVVIEKEYHMVLSLSINKKGKLVASYIHPDMIINNKQLGRGVTQIIFPNLTINYLPETNNQEDNNEPEVVSNPDRDNDEVSSTFDFAQCYDGCLETVQAWILGIVEGICAACVGTIASQLIPGVQPVSVPLLLVACGSCALSAAAVGANCFLTCHEMYD